MYKKAKNTLVVGVLPDPEIKEGKRCHLTNI